MGSVGVDGAASTGFGVLDMDRGVGGRHGHGASVLCVFVPRSAMRDRIGEGRFERGDEQTETFGSPSFDIRDGQTRLSTDRRADEILQSKIWREPRATTSIQHRNKIQTISPLSL